MGISKASNNKQGQRIIGEECVFNFVNFFVVKVIKQCQRVWRMSSFFFMIFFSFFLSFAEYFDGEVEFLLVQPREKF